MRQRSAQPTSEASSPLMLIGCHVLMGEVENTAQEDLKTAMEKELRKSEWMFSPPESGKKKSCSGCNGPVEVSKHSD